MPIYIRKKNVKIFKLYQNWGMTFSLILAYEKKKKVIFIFVFRFTNKQIQKKKTRNENLLMFSVLPFICKKYKKTRHENLPPLFVLRFISKKYRKTKKENLLPFGGQNIHSYLWFARWEKLLASYRSKNVLCLLFPFLMCFSYQ